MALVLILGLRDMRANLPRLGQLAHAETGNDEWGQESYVYGPLALGITAAPVNETARQCEDLKFMRERTGFVKRMTSYSAGQVTNLGHASASDIRRYFLIPNAERVKTGMSKAKDPQAQTDAIEQAVERLAALSGKVVEWYLTYEFFHVQCKHGLKLPFRPIGGRHLAHRHTATQDRCREPNQRQRRTGQRFPADLSATGERDNETVHATLELAEPVTPADFA